MMADLLDYESKMLVDTFSDDCLFIFARGLGIERLFLHHLKLYSHPKVLVLVVNTRPQDEEYLLANMKSLGEGETEPKIITNEISVAERQRCYLKGGVQFVTTRILVVDFLMNRVPVDLVTGILVFRAETVLDSFQESFILRMFRERKLKGGFVKAFTDSPSFFGLKEIGQLQRLVTKLFVRKVLFLPRFEAEVKICLEKTQPEVVELGIDLSPRMKKIQIYMMEIISACAKELKQCNPGVQLDDVDPSKRGDEMFAALRNTGLESKLETEISQLSEKSRRLLSELRTLRVLLHQMEQLDPVSFFQSLDILKNNEKAFMTNSGWIFTSAAQKMFSETKMRVSGTDGIEAPPKWRGLSTVLKEIRDLQCAESTSSQENGNVLLVAANMPCCKLLSDLMASGEKKLLRVLENNLNQTTGAGAQRVSEEGNENPLDIDEESWCPKDSIRFSTAKKRFDEEEQTEEDEALIRRNLGKAKTRGKRKAEEDSQKQLTLAQTMKRTEKRKKRLNSESETVINLDSEDIRRKEAVVLEETENIDEETVVPVYPTLTLFSLENRRYELMKTLDDVQPMFVILYHANLDTIRQIEIYKATRGVSRLRVYFLMYNKSVEEEEYLSSLHREKQAFHHIIQENASLLVPREFDVSRDQPMKSNHPASTRRAGGQRNEAEETQQPQIIVDMREFRSELPSIIYKRGMEVVPLTIEVGDYILTPDTCVERKTVWDLVGSLQNGRVYKQAQQMLRHYKRAILLVETECAAKRAGSKRWRGGPFGGEMGPGNRDIRAKLTVLTRQCPNLRVVWSVSPQTTVELFEDLKWQKPEPDSDVVSSIKADEIGPGEKKEKYNPTGRKMCLKLPGVTEKNVENFMDNCGSLWEICQNLGSAKEQQYPKKLKLNQAGVNKIRKFCDTDFRKK